MIFKDSGEINKKEKGKTTGTVETRVYCSNRRFKAAWGVI
jgi:hypothetical protein